MMANNECNSARRAINDEKQKARDRKAGVGDGVEGQGKRWTCLIALALRGGHFQVKRPVRSW
jgi:hypothetical protein